MWHILYTWCQDIYQILAFGIVNLLLVECVDFSFDNYNIIVSNLFGNKNLTHNKVSKLKHMTKNRYNTQYYVFEHVQNIKYIILNVC